MFSSYPVQAVNDNAVIQLCLWKSLTIELVVNNEVKRSAEIWYITLESLVRINGDFKAVKIQTIIWLKELLHIRVLIAFHLPGRKTLTTEILKSLVAHLIEHGCSMFLYHLLRLSVEVYILFFALHCSFFFEVLSKEWRGRDVFPGYIQ